MSEYENRKILGIIIECAKLTPEIFEKAIEDTLNNITNKHSQGKTSLNKLMKTGKVDSIAVKDNNIGSFAKTARKYNLTYAVKRIQGQDNEGNPQKQYLVCFHGKDMDTLQKAFREFSYNQLHQKETLFSRKKVSEIQVTVPEQENELSRTKQKEHKKKRSAKHIER